MESHRRLPAEDPRENSEQGGDGDGDGGGGTVMVMVDCLVDKHDDRDVMIIVKLANIS